MFAWLSRRGRFENLRSQHQQEWKALNFELVTVDLTFHRHSCWSTTTPHYHTPQRHTVLENNNSTDRSPTRASDLMQTADDSRCLIEYTRVLSAHCLTL